VVFESLGVAWSLATPSIPFVAALMERLPPLVLARPGLRAERRYVVEPVEGNGSLRVRGGARRPIDADDAAFAADWVADDLQRFLAQRAPARVLVHAGAVSWRGQAIVLPGASGSGKSRWVEALLRRGAGYLADDLVAFDAEGRAEGFARPLALRREDGSFDRRAAGALGAASVGEPLPVAAVVFGSYRPSATWSLEPLTPARCAVDLLRHTSAARRRLDLARQVLPRVAAGARAARARRGDAEAAAERLLEWLT
jgi:hypothetical protein